MRCGSPSALGNASAVGQAGQARTRPQPWDLLGGLRPVRERVLGPTRPETLRTRDELGRWTGKVDGGPYTA